MSQPKITPHTIGDMFSKLENQIARIESSVSNVAAAISGVGFVPDGTIARTSPIGLLPSIHSDQENLARQLARVQTYLDRLERYVSGLPEIDGRSEQEARANNLDRASTEAMAKALSPRPVHPLTPGAAGAA